MLRKLFFGFVAMLFLIILVSTIIITFFEKELGQKILKEVNKSLKTELSVGEFELSLFSGFPKASANLRQVKLADTNSGNLLEADNLAFRFGLFSLFGSNINLHSLVIQDGALYVHKDKKGKTNYDVVQTSDTESSGSDLSISLNEASLENIELIYSDEQAEQETRMLVNDAIFSGEFSSDQFALSSYAALESSFIDVNGARFLPGKALDYDAKIAVDLAKGTYTFENVKLGVESNVFNITGIVNSENDGLNYDLEVTSEDGNIESIIQLLPAEYLEYIGDFRSTGTFLFDTKIEGKQTAKSNPSIQVNLGLREGQIKSDRLANSLKDVSFTAWFSNGKYRNNKTTLFEIRDFKGYFNRELTEMKLKIENLEDPKIDFELDGNLPLESVYGLLNNEAITDGDGEIEIKDLNIKGRYEDMLSTSRISRVDAGGTIEFDDASLTINKQEMIVDRGKLILKDNDLKVSAVKLEGASSEMTLNGDFYNLIPVLFADSLNTKKAELDFKARLNAKELDLDKLMRLTEIQVEQDEVSKEVYDSLLVENALQRERFINLLNGNFDLLIDNFNYNKIQGTEFEGGLAFDSGEVLLDGDVETMDGSMNLEGKVFFEEKPRLKANVICKDINVQKFFYQTENFGQDFIVSDNLKGVLNSNFSVNAYWDAEGTFLTDKLRVLAGVSIKDGELVGFKLLEDFSTFIKVKDLRHIKFVNMQNWLEVRRGKLYLPAMFIQSNAVNLTVTGEHTFDHDIDYGIKVNAGQVLLSKFKKHDPLLKPQKAKKKGMFDLYYSIVGNIDDYEVKNSKRKVQKDFELSEHRKDQVRKLLEKEFQSIKLLEKEPENWRKVAPIPEFEEAGGQEEYLEEIKTPNTNKPTAKNKIPEFDEADDDTEEYIDFEEGDN